jgi:hypothetical protein
VIKIITCTDFNLYASSLTVNFPNYAGCAITAVVTDEYCTNEVFAALSVVSSVTISYAAGYPSVTINISSNGGYYYQFREAVKVSLLTAPDSGYGILSTASGGNKQAGDRVPCNYLYGKYLLTTLNTTSAPANFTIGNVLPEFDIDAKTYWWTHKLVIPFSQIPNNSNVLFYTDVPTYPNGVSILGVKRYNAEAGEVNNGVLTGWNIYIRAKGYTPTLYVYTPTSLVSGKVYTGYGIVVRDSFGNVTFDSSEKMLATLPAASGTLTHPGTTLNFTTDYFTVPNLPTTPVMFTGCGRKLVNYYNLNKTTTEAHEVSVKLWSKSDATTLRADWYNLYAASGITPLQYWASWPTRTSGRNSTFTKYIGDALAFA